MKNKIPLYILSATTEDEIDVNNFFESGEGSITWELEHPGKLRQYGWSLETLDKAKIVEGEYYELKNGEQKTIQFFKDGTLIVLLYADNSLLAWGNRVDDFKEKPKLNTLAVIEITYCFVELYRKLIEKYLVGPVTLVFKWELRNLHFDNGKKVYIVPHNVNSVEYLTESDKGEATNDYLTWYFKSELDNINKYDSEKIAFTIIESLFGMFNVASNMIPYTRQGRISIDMIKGESKT